MLSGLQSGDRYKQHDIPTCPSQRSSTQQSRKGGTNIQGPLRGNFMRSRQIVSTKFMGPTATTSRAHLQYATPSQMTPTVSAYTYLWGQHDYNTNPFMPMGCKVEAHIVPGIRETWAPHTASSKRLLRRSGMGVLPLPRHSHQ